MRWLKKSEHNANTIFNLYLTIFQLILHALLLLPLVLFLEALFLFVVLPVPADASQYLHQRLSQFDRSCAVAYHNTDVQKRHKE